MNSNSPAVDTTRFDQIASNWDEDPSRVALARAVAVAIGERVSLSPAQHLLDYGCGTGLLTLALQPLAGRVTGADTSAGMLSVLEQKVTALSLPNVTTVRLVPEDGYRVAGEYDGIVSSMTLHHVPDPKHLLQQFHTQLRPGGFVALADLDHEDGTFHKPGITDVYHLGFERSDVRKWLEEAGFANVADTTAFVHQRHGREYPVFLITART